LAIATLDYPKAKLVMEAENQVEQTYRLHACAKEPWTVAFVESIPAGGIFWDIGANTGPYSLIAASRNLTVVAVEPACNNYAALCRNLALNNYLNRAIVLCCALGDRTGFDWLHYRDLRQGAASHVIGGVRTQFFHKQLIPLWTWDELWPRLPLPPDRPHYAKIDVDGGEVGLLKGASQTLQRPALAGILIEMQDAQEPEITKLLAAAGWKLAERFNERNGQPIPGLAYGRFAR
jgi:FkbM family methyltransferase